MPSKFIQPLLKPKSYTIVTHTRPDGDAIGSQLGLGLFLRKLGKDVIMVAEEPLTSNLAWMIEGVDYLIYDESIQQRLEINNTEAVVVVDTNARKRLGKLETPVAQHTGPTYLIDHHPDPEDWFQHKLVQTRASSAGELIYRLIAAHDPDLIDRTMAIALYTAIMTDTGSFRFNSVTPRVHRIVADLLDRGEFNPEPVHSAMFNNRTQRSIRLLGMALETLTLTYGGKVAYMYVSQKMFEKTGAISDDIQGFVDYLLAVEGVEAGVLFTEFKLNVKMSFRSSGQVAINKWAQHFGGGGHRNASGAFIRGRLKRTIPKVMDAGVLYLPFEADVPVPDSEVSVPNSKE